jgi:hypothetical protein
MVSTMTTSSSYLSSSSSRTSLHHANTEPTSPGGVFITAAPSTLTTVVKPTSTKKKIEAVAKPTSPAATPAGAIAPQTPCTDEGMWNCIGGTQFQRCASGLWSPVQNMASGTACKPGLSTTLWAKRSRDIAIRGGARIAV